MQTHEFGIIVSSQSGVFLSTIGNSPGRLQACSSIVIDETDHENVLHSCFYPLKKPDNPGISLSPGYRTAFP